MPDIRILNQYTLNSVFHSKVSMQLFFFFNLELLDDIMLGGQVYTKSLPSVSDLMVFEL